MNIQAICTQNTQRDRLYVAFAFSVLLSLFALYMYFVSASVVHVVMREESQRKISTLHSEISSLEAKYIKAQHSVSSDIAKLSGYVSATEKVFIGREDDTLVLSTNQER
ncbi:MAG: uncharacterized membrane-anchored protein YitT (DUF2179 family) [Candidatus Azotimanducaceae bacterium]|jgi:uncharacterized membrane-anchored protein YitT (DUF2179 family)